MGREEKVNPRSTWYKKRHAFMLIDDVIPLKTIKPVLGQKVEKRHLTIWQNIKKFFLKLIKAMSSIDTERDSLYL
jgi:hypothetical protein